MNYTTDDITEILMWRDGLTEDEARDVVNDARLDFEDRLHNPDEFGFTEDLCMDWFGLEPDYLMAFI